MTKHIADAEREEPFARVGGGRFARRRRIVVLIIGAAALLGIGTTAWAYWTTTGNGTASASTGNLNAPTNVTANATAGSGTVSVSWTGSTLSTGQPVTGYYVTRVRTSDNSMAAACGTSSAQPTSTAPCNDTGVPNGSYQYMVTAVYASWTAASTPSATVIVVNDNTPPTVPAPVASAAVSFGTNPMFVNHEVVTLTDGATDAGSGVNSVSYYYCGAAASSCTSSNGTLIGSSTTASNNFTVTTGAPFASPDGAYQIVAIATDNANNTSGSSAATLVAVDTVPPTVSRPTVNGHS